MRVGFDLDGVLYDFRQAHSDFEVARGNTHCAIENAADHWDYFEGWGQTLEDWLDSYADGVNAGHVLWLGEPMAGAVNTFAELRRRGHSIHIITDRSIGDDPQGATRAWLETHGLTYDSLTFSRDKTCVPTDIYIDDRLQNADAVNAAGTLCYLINRPWNQTGSDHRPRVDTLEQYVEAVEQWGRVMINGARSHSTT